MDYYGPMSSRHRLALLLLAAALGAHAQDAPPSPPASSTLNSELFYQLLLGELSFRNSDAGTAFSLMLDAARKTGDVRLYQRAVDIALQARAGDSALQAARAWRQAQPNSREANRYILQILIALNRLSEAVEPLKRELALAEPQERSTVISALPRFFARASNKKQATTTVEQALADYLGAGLTGAAAWTTVGRMRLEAGDAHGALEAARRGQAVDARAEDPVLLALLLMNPARPQAEALVRKHLDAQARPELRMEYARRLLEAQRYADAYGQVQRINLEKPEFAEAWLVRGTLELQDKQLDVAEQSLLRYAGLVQPAQTSPDAEQHRGLVQAYLTLSHIAEQRKDTAAANAWLARITDPQDMVRVQSRRAELLARQGRIDEARQLLRNLPERTPAEARAKLSAEVQLLREHKLFQAAYDLLAAATQREPRDHELLYDQAAMAEKLGRLGEMEQLLRQVMAIKPDYPHAYNALGYSFADRNIRLAEARQLILKALEYAPGDPFITDSLGWVEFRLGNLADALRILQGAYKSRPDAEIAAHLGEVLWRMGRREQALAIWREGLGLNAENETLVETLKRLDVQP